MNMSKRIGVLALAIVASAATMAGSKFNGDGHVQINKNADGSGLAVAYLGAIYNGDGTTEWMGCQKSAKDRVFCHARTEQGVQVSCSVTSSYLATALSSMSADARLIFTWDAKGVCTGVSVQHSSEYQDKQG